MSGRQAHLNGCRVVTKHCLYYTDDVHTSITTLTDGVCTVSCRRQSSPHTYTHSTSFHHLVSLLCLILLSPPRLTPTV
ncbi:hypothetical protein E2C01_094943 [Portunus trituberculatus]|uniref:Uncharacterized protein n=1 Tax=Portunus trituberculatus TaxID=210409 RepID=A0A5B7K4H4_PORTR|nr:hypothetical protein [Portunus trituberculatus]